MIDIFCIPNQVGNNISLADIHLFFFCSEYTTPPMLTVTPKVPHKDSHNLIVATNHAVLTSDCRPGSPDRSSSQYPAVDSCPPCFQALKFHAPMIPDPLWSGLNKVPRQIVGHLWSGVIYYWRSRCQKLELSWRQSLSCVRAWQTNLSPVLLLGRHAPPSGFLAARVEKA